MIVEDGTGLPNADSYVSVEFADTYFSARGVSVWATLTNTVKEQLLIKATDFIDNIYQWNGKRKLNKRHNQLNQLMRHEAHKMPIQHL